MIHSDEFKTLEPCRIIANLGAISEFTRGLTVLSVFFSCYGSAREHQNLYWNLYFLLFTARALEANVTVMGNCYGMVSG